MLIPVRSFFLPCVRAIGRISTCLLRANSCCTNYYVSLIRMYSIVERGSPFSAEYRVFFNDGNNIISPFHDIPYLANEADKIYNMVVEVPRWTNAKMEIATKEPLNPIKQDVKKGKLRFVHNVFPHHGYIWNYGAIPQTWEDPNHVDDVTECKGDNDPIDICEIGQRVASRGDVLQVKVLGVFALIDEGETDWKIIAIDVKDPLAPSLNDIEDVNKYMPGLLQATVEWFRFYKVPAGNPENKFAFDSKPKDREFAEKIIVKTHVQWEKLMTNPSNSSGLSCACVSVEKSPHKIGSPEASSVMEQFPEPTLAQPIDSEVDKWHFILEK